MKIILCKTNDQAEESTYIYFFRTNVFYYIIIIISLFVTCLYIKNVTFIDDEINNVSLRLYYLIIHNIMEIVDSQQYYNDV